MPNPEYPPAIEPVFITSTPNQPIEILKDRATITSPSGFSVSGECTLTRSWLPEPEIVIELKLSESSLDILKIWQEQMNAPLPTITLKGWDGNPGSCLITRPGTNELIGHVASSWFVAKAEKVKAVFFHLVNLPSILGQPVRYGGTNLKASRIDLRSGDWEIVIDEVQNHEEVDDAIRSSGGFGITHVGRLGKVSGDAFAHDNVGDILHAIWRFFSFVQGAWVGPVLSVGVNGEGERCWWDLSPTLCDSRRNNAGWLSRTYPASLEKLWPLFFSRWQETYWRDVLSRAIWWYVGAAKQAGGTDGAIVLIQAGLELLAWVNFVEQKKLLSRKGFGDLPASDKMRLLVGAMNMSVDFPEGLENLRSLALKRRWSAAPWAFTEVRNRLVHPKNRTEIDRPESINEAYWLGMHYLELAILYSCGYTGEYRNRLAAKSSFQSERVPWAK